MEKENSAVLSASGSSLNTTEDAIQLQVLLHQITPHIGQDSHPLVANWKQLLCSKWEYQNAQVKVFSSHDSIHKAVKFKRNVPLLIKWRCRDIQESRPFYVSMVYFGPSDHPPASSPSLLTCSQDLTAMYFTPADESCQRVLVIPPFGPPRHDSLTPSPLLMWTWIRMDWNDSSPEFQTLSSWTNDPLSSSLELHPRMCCWERKSRQET